MGECSSFSCIVEILNECGKGIEFRGCSVPVVNQKLKGLRVTIRLKLLLDFVEDGGLIIVYGTPYLLQLQPLLIRNIGFREECVPDQNSHYEVQQNNS